MKYIHPHVLSHFFEKSFSIKVRSRFAHLDGVHGGSEDRVVVLDAPPEPGSDRTGQVAPVLLQDAQGFDESAQRVQSLMEKTVVRVTMQNTVTHSNSSYVSGNNIHIIIFKKRTNLNPSFKNTDQWETQLGQERQRWMNDGAAVSTTTKSHLKQQESLLC